MERGIIQVLPRKVKRHLKGRPVTIPIHSELERALVDATSRRVSKDGVVSITRDETSRVQGKDAEASITRDETSRVQEGEYVIPTIAEWYLGPERWRVGDGLKRIFKAAKIKTSILIEGRKTATPDATFHSLRHTFVSLSANAGVPLAVVQSIVGHTSTAMTRHYYHENEVELRRAVESIPSLSEMKQTYLTTSTYKSKTSSTQERLNVLAELQKAKCITESEYLSHRVRILAEL